MTKGSVLQCVAVCCSVLQCVAVCCSVLQCFAISCGVLRCVAVCFSAFEECCSVVRTSHPRPGKVCGNCTILQHHDANAATPIFSKTFAAMTKGHEIFSVLHILRNSHKSAHCQIYIMELLTFEILKHTQSSH